MAAQVGNDVIGDYQLRLAPRMMRGGEKQRRFRNIPRGECQLFCLLGMIIQTSEREASLAWADTAAAEGKKWGKKRIQDVFLASFSPF